MADRLLDEPRFLPPTPTGLGRRPRRGPGRLLAVLALAGFFVAGVLIVIVGLSHGSGTKAAPPVAKPKPHPPRPAPATTAKRAKPPPAPPIHVAAIRAFDPAGDGQENDSSAPLATDGNPTTFWHTEHYRTWYKPGVGLVLDAGRPVRPTALTLQTDDPGFVAEVQAGSSPTGPFTRISESATTNNTTVYGLRAPSAERYILLWITRIPDGGDADVNEVRLR